jgi:hypothetical protein
MTDLTQLIPDDKKREDALEQFVRDIEATKKEREDGDRRDSSRAKK